MLSVCYFTLPPLPPPPTSPADVFSPACLCSQKGKKRERNWKSFHLRRELISSWATAPEKNGHMWR